MALSKGEELIKNILEREGISFKREYSFPDLLSFKKKPLRFDFAIIENGKVTALIEWDGQQHYEYIEHFSKNKQKWNYLRANDVKKCRYALMNNIPLYHIPYTQIDKIYTSKDIFNESFKIKNKFDLMNRYIERTTKI
jgi:hypothetical protein